MEKDGMEKNIIVMEIIKLNIKKDMQSIIHIIHA